MSKILAGLKILFQSPGSYKIAFLSCAVLALVYYWLFKQISTIDDFIRMTKSGDFGKYSMAFGMAYWFFTIATIAFFGISTAAVFWLFRHSKLNKTSSFSNVLGTLVGAFASACPICGALLFSLIGLSGGLSIFPMLGLELKIASFLLIAGSAIFALWKIAALAECQECSDLKIHRQKQEPKVLSLQSILIYLLTILFLFNQFLIGEVMNKTGLSTGSGLVQSLFQTKHKSSYSIIAPKINPDGKTTSLVEQPTISEVPANPNTANALADAKVVMIAKGKPVYAPEDISFDDPINAQNKWGAYEKSLKLNEEQEKKYQKFIGTFTCNYCCGSANQVALNKNCACAHAKAARGYFRYMTQTFGDKYSDEQILGEAFLWQAIWYPKGALQDYLLATGKSEALPHEPHGGSGPNNHGLK